MTTAEEIQARVIRGRATMNQLARQYEITMVDALTYGMFAVIWREVCSRRWRKLQRRGEVVMFIRKTKTGKARYGWMRRIAPRT